MSGRIKTDWGSRKIAVKWTTLLASIAQYWRDMPSYFKVSWQDYRVRPRPNSILRLSMMAFTSFKRDIMPVFDGTELILDLRGQKINKLAESRLNYKWIVCDENNNRETQEGLGEIMLPRIGAIFTELKAIKIKQIIIPGKYVLRIQLSNDINGVSDYQDISRFTVRDWDDFCLGVVWPVLLAVLISLIGGVIGWFLRG